MDDSAVPQPCSVLPHVSGYLGTCVQWVVMHRYLLLLLIAQAGKNGSTDKYREQIRNMMMKKKGSIEPSFPCFSLFHLVWVRFVSLHNF